MSIDFIRHKGEDLMKRNRIFAAGMAVLCSLLCICPGGVPVRAEELADSGINYTERVGTVRTPGAGYTSTLSFRCRPGETKAYNPTGELVLMFVDIGGFSSGSNGTTDPDGNYTPGEDADLDETFFRSMRTTLENCRQNGCMAALRFRYDANGVRDPEPATFEQMLRHIEQIRQDGFLEDYKDILSFVESGFVGCYGEQWGGKYCSIPDKARLLDLLLDVVPDPVPVTVRTPNIFAQWAGITEEELGTYVLEPGSRAARVGLYNDGYMGSNSDLGTFHDRERDLKWLRQQTLFSYYGGEFSGNLDFAKQYETYLPENAVPEMYYTHLSYINSNIYQLYKDYTFGAEYDVPDVDNSAYYGQTVFQFIRDHLGYRFVLRKSALSESVPQGGTLRLSMAVENTGFANPIPAQTGEILLEKDGNYIRTQVDVDSRTWYSCTTVSPEFELKLPAALEPGRWNVYFKLSVGDNSLDQLEYRSVEFANEGIWNGQLGANYLGSFTVTDSPAGGTDNGFYQTNAARPVERSDGAMYTTRDLITVDGMVSSDTERNASMLRGEDEAGNRMYITNDDKYLYVLAELEQNAGSPVYNLSFRNGSNGTSYWMYYQGSFVYFNGEGGVPLGCVQKHSGSSIEFRLPLGELMGLLPGARLTDITYTVQDQADSWKKTGSIRADSYLVQEGFNVYSAMQTVRLARQETMYITARTSGTDLTYHWFKDGVPIPGASGQTYAISADSEEAEGIYSVTVSAADGSSRSIDLCRVAAVTDPAPLGDVNLDGAVTVADAVLLQKHLIGAESLTLQQAYLADLRGDGILNGFDLVLLRRMLCK